HALGELARFFPEAGAAWTAGAVLPGGDMPGADLDAFVAQLQREWPDLPPALVLRLARAYGTKARILLGTARGMADLGEDLGGGLTMREVDYLRTREWARTAEDILYRRSKLALHVPPGTAARLGAYLAQA